MPQLDEVCGIDNGKAGMTPAALTPAGTPTPILDKVHADLTAVLRMPEIQQRLKGLVVEIALTSREEFAQFIRAETAR